jgi:high-affinity iron transporter
VLATTVIVFREVFEVALIVGIVAAATAGVTERSRWIAIGLAAGSAGALIVAAFAQQIAASVSGIGQELVNASVLFAAVTMLGWHNVWMSRHGREIAQKMNKLGAEVSAGARPLYALAVVVAVAVLREGSEVVLFLHGVAAAAQGPQTANMLLGGAVGLAGGVAVGFVLYLGLMRVLPRHLFSVTSWMILLLAAGMASQGAHYLVQADVLPPLGLAIWDSSGLLSEHSLPGQALHVLVGYSDRPSGLQIVFYLATLIVIGSFMRILGRPGGAPGGRTIPSALGLAIFAFGLFGFDEPAHAHHKVYSPYVEQGAVELEYRSHVTEDDRASKDNAQRHRFEIGYGALERWHTSIFFDFDKAPNGDLEHTATAWENIIQLTEQGERWIDTGLYLEYKAAAQSDKADKIEAKLLLEKPVFAIANTANIIIEKQIGEHSEGGLELGYAWRSKWRFSPLFEPGFEAHGEFGEVNDFNSSEDQDHRIGPAIYGKIELGGFPGYVKYEAGYLVGLTEASPDGTAKFLLEYEFHL